VVIQADDGNGGISNQSFNISVANVNDAPIFNSSPVLSGIEDFSYEYTVKVIDNDGDTCDITAPTLPSWLTLTDNGNNSAVLSGTPSNDNIGVNAIVIQVNDRNGGVSNQSFNISVAENIQEEPNEETILEPNIDYIPGSDIDYVIEYDNSVRINELSGLILNVHFNSNSFTFNQDKTTNMITDDLFINEFKYKDDSTNLFETDKVIQFIWVDIESKLPREELWRNSKEEDFPNVTTILAKISFTVKAEYDPNHKIHISISESSSGYKFKS
jgi:hypothetical protein